MRFSAGPTEARLTKVRANWTKMSRLGLPLFVLTRGMLLFIWMCICYVGLMYQHGTQRLLHQTFVIASTLPCMALLSFFYPAAYYWMVQQMVRRIGPAEA